MKQQLSPEQPRAPTAEERAAAAWNLAGGVRRHGPAFAAFAEAVGHVNVLRDPGLFRRAYVGHWPNMATFVNAYAEESGLNAAVDELPPRIRSFITVDHRRVAEELRSQLLVLDVEREVWVFDAQNVVNSTVE